MRSYDLIVVGAGSGNMLLGPELNHLRASIIESDRFGGTCLNRGCIPSKMLVVAADAVRAVPEARRLGVHATLDRVDWPAIRARVFGRLDPLHDSAVEHRRRGGIDVYTAPARFVAPRVLEVAGERLTAEQIVVAAGSRLVVPDIPGLNTVPFHTSDTIMRIDEVPSRDRRRLSDFGARRMGVRRRREPLPAQAHGQCRGAGRTAQLTHPDALRGLSHDLIPHAIFSDPQVAGVGLTEQEARRLGIDYTTAVRPYADTAYGWALEDTTSFVKLIADPHARMLLGAHIIGPQAAVLLQPLLQAMMLGQTVDQLAHHVLYVHPALSEVLEQALLELWALVQTPGWAHRDGGPLGPCPGGVCRGTGPWG